MSERRPIVLVVQAPRGDAGLSLAHLDGADFVTWHAASGAEARKVLLAAREAGLLPDVIVVERELPDVDGLVLCSFLHDVTDCPIVLCAREAGEVDRTLAYRAGVEGFVGMPTIADELHALIAGLLRAQATGATNEVVSDRPMHPVSYGNLLIDEHQRTARIGDYRLQLSPTEYRLLVALARCAPTVVPRVELGELVWNGLHELPAPLIASHITRLRARLSEVPGVAPAIVAVPRVGYRLGMS